MLKNTEKKFRTQGNYKENTGNSILIGTWQPCLNLINFATKNNTRFHVLIKMACLNIG